MFQCLSHLYEFTKCNYCILYNLKIVTQEVTL